MRMNVSAAIVILAVGLCGAAMAQATPPGAGSDGTRGEWGAGANFHGVGGQITAIEGATITLQTFRGEVAKVNVTASTRLTKDHNAAKLSDFKVGDQVFAPGEQGKDGVWTAQALIQRGASGSRGAGGAPPKPEDNGKSYIVGKITKIEGTKLTIRKPDSTEQVIEVDDETSFRNGRESVTLVDLKIGDLVRGQGAVKNGIFVPKELNAGRARGARPGTAPPDGAPQERNQIAPDSSDQKK